MTTATVLKVGPLWDDDVQRLSEKIQAAADDAGQAMRASVYSASVNDRKILCIGHRGAAGHAPENTLAAIPKGLALGGAQAYCETSGTAREIWKPATWRAQFDDVRTWFARLKPVPFWLTPSC